MRPGMSTLKYTGGNLSIFSLINGNIHRIKCVIDFRKGLLKRMTLFSVNAEDL